jgi:hypothetical protein
MAMEFQREIVKKTNFIAKTRDFSFHGVQTAFGAHAIDTRGSFPGGKAAGT